ncbi:MAG: hypothetical protein IIU51_02520 [Bacteroidaceae bacterium]|nr:hypothetical protein [Bacteroidaceae bacterium]
MVVSGVAHCLFEQSGTFRNAFLRRGITAYDYDIRDDFGCTDYVCDLFTQIENAFDELPSLFDRIKEADIVMAFFPCTYFSQQNITFFNGTQNGWKQLTQEQINMEVILRDIHRHRYYQILLKLCTIAEQKGFRLIIENPYSTEHFLYNNFPYKPAVIDRNRQLRGDFFRKPTQYYFINCKPTYGESFHVSREKKRILSLNGKHGSRGQTERSLISDDYAEAFISDFILGVSKKMTQQTLQFN